MYRGRAITKNRRKGKPVRLLGVRLSELTNHPVQASLFDDAEKKNNLYKAIDDVKNKFGKASLKKARTVTTIKRMEG